MGKVKRQILKQLIKAATEGVLLLSGTREAREVVSRDEFQRTPPEGKYEEPRSYVMLSLLRYTRLPCLNNPRFNTNYPRFIETPERESLRLLNNLRIKITNTFVSRPLNLPRSICWRYSYITHLLFKVSLNKIKIRKIFQIHLENVTRI